MYAMRGDFDLKDLEAGLVRAEKFQSAQEQRNASVHALVVARADSDRTGAEGGARGQGRQGRRSGKRHDNSRNQHHQQQGHPQQASPGQQQQQPPPWQRQQLQKSHAWQQQRHPQPQQRGPRHQLTPPGPLANWERPPPHQQFNPCTSWQRPPPQQQYHSGGPHPRRRHHRGGDQPHWQQALYQRCGEEEHFPADCRAAAPAPVPQHRPYAASSFSGAHTAQYETFPLPLGHRTTAMDIRPLQATGLRRNTLAMHLPRRCHRCPDLWVQLHEIHLHRRLPRNLTETSPPGNPRRYGHNTCLQGSLRVRISMNGVQKWAV